jgi:FkbM family methyltransferase
MSVETAERPYGTGELPLMPPAVRRARLLSWQRIDTVIDVGANAGQYARALRAAGYAGRIVSVEPLTQAFAELARAATDDPLWEVHRVALGVRSGRAELNVSSDLEASSLLPMEERHVRHCPASAYVGTETVEVDRLDSLASGVLTERERVYLKLDVQGYELEVLRGGEGTLVQVAGVAAELSLVPLYGHGPLYREVIDHLDRRGFGLISLEGITEEPETGHMLQLDGVFVRDESDSGSVAKVRML